MVAVAAHSVVVALGATSSSFVGIVGWEPGALGVKIAAVFEVAVFEAAAVVAVAVVAAAVEEVGAVAVVAAVVVAVAACAGTS